MDEQVFKIIESDKLNESFRIIIDFEEKCFKLTILQKIKAWMVTVDRGKICSQAKQLELDVDDYYKKIQEYFMKTPENVDFKLSNNEFVINCSLENNMKVKYFACKLKEVNYSNCIESLIEKYYTERINSLQRLKTVEKERCECEKEKHMLETKLNDFIQRKKVDDQELYSKFVLILNEKERRIQHLNELLEAFRRGRPTFNAPVEVKKRTTKSEVIQHKNEIKREISESDSENSYDTDEEKQKKSPHSESEDLGDIDKNKNITDPLPTTSKCDFNLFCDDSPPRYLLPKRIKSESVEVNHFSKHSTSEGTSRTNKDEENVSYRTKEDSPNVNFSTQDLLDNI